MNKNQNLEDITVEQFDECGIYCRMLGHDLTFKYCRCTGDGHFCRRIFDCWHDKIAVGRYVKTHFSEDVIREVLHPAAPKLHSLLNLIEKAEKPQKPE